MSDILCSDCPPVSHPTDETRCAPCPRRTSDDAPCTDCGGTGVTFQTERRCACTSGPRATASQASRASDPGRFIALIALDDSGSQPGEMLEAVIRFAFDQLCWVRTTPQLEAFVGGLRALMSEDA